MPLPALARYQPITGDRVTWRPGHGRCGGLGFKAAVVEEMRDKVSVTIRIAVRRGGKLVHARKTVLARNLHPRTVLCAVDGEALAAHAEAAAEGAK